MHVYTEKKSVNVLPRSIVQSAQQKKGNMGIVKIYPLNAPLMVIYLSFIYYYY